jgi:Na+/H+ antiporter NhaD/arsenite permease-like protein
MSHPHFPKRFMHAALTGAAFFVPGIAAAAETETGANLTGHWVGYASLVLFVLAYAVVVSEEFLHLRKSKPVIVAAGIIWVLIAAALAHQGDRTTAEEAVRHNILEFGELFLFLLAAMTYINTMSDRGIFDSLRGWLVSQGFSLRTVYWITGLLAFFISPVADNLTTALLMSTVVMTVGGKNRSFVTVACINIVVAANAGGAFSPFGDITTLMVWQKEVVRFGEFFRLFVPSVVNWLVPALIMSFSVPKTAPEAHQEKPVLLDGAWMVVALFGVTITMAVSFHNFLHLPPVLGMMTGLGFLKLYGYHLKLRSLRNVTPTTGPVESALGLENHAGAGPAVRSPDEPFNIFKQLERAEWDTLMFFYGIILCVGGLGTIGYLALGSQMMYGDMGPTAANVLVGLVSAIVDNIPVMFAVLTMNPDMAHGQWLLVTLTAGVGGSLLSIGSAAGVAVMGQARGVYTFFSHLKWTWAIALGYAVSIWAHFLVNRGHF